MPRKDIDYSKCIIYKIVCNDFDVKDLYVGHTTDLVKRRSQHKATCNSPKSSLKIYKTIRENGGWENWTVVVIERFETCKDSEEARTRERYWFDELNACMNSIKPMLTNDEKSELNRRNAKISYENNKESIKNRCLEYYHNNKASLKEYTKKYCQDNKDKLVKYRKEYRENNQDAIKGYREKSKDKMKQYYLDHKEQILEKQKEYKKQQRIKNTESIEFTNTV